MLRLGRIELLATLEDNAEYILDSNPGIAEAVEAIAVPISSKPYYLMLSRQFVSAWPELSERIWTTIASVSARELKRLYARYLDSPR